VAEKRDVLPVDREEGEGLHAGADIEDLPSKLRIDVLLLGLRGADVENLNLANASGPAPSRRRVIKS
jgi:hypothetical protein